MQGADWIALTAVIAGALTAVYSLTGQHRTNLAMRRFEERWGAYIEYIIWFEQHPKSDPSGPPAKLRARLMAWGSHRVTDLTTKDWTPATGGKVNDQIRKEFEARRRPQAWGMTDFFASLSARMRRLYQRMVGRG